MQKKEIVISLGGSLIVPNEIDTAFLNQFKKIIQKNTKKNKFVIVCGGGSTARKYIKALNPKSPNHSQSLIGILITRLNAKFMGYFFEKKPKEVIPKDMKSIKNTLAKNDIVFCGALRYHHQETSDATSVKLAKFLKTSFINITNVDGLYTEDPKKNKKAKFIERITPLSLYNMIKKEKYYPGQHVILDQEAVRIIKENNIKSYIVGKDLKNLDNLLNNKNFKGTIIE